MGAVYKAEDTRLDRTVALKFLAPHLLNDAEAKARFIREAKAAAGLDHANVCTVFEVGEEGGRTFLAMAFLEGESLEDRIATGPQPLKDAIEISRQVADGLEAAHEKGIVHRDIKPANIMVDAKGRATILDFGLARLTEASKLTRADQTVGTAAYMSPEQIQGAEVDQRTDIWALGCVLYEMVAGLRPFKGQYDQALAYEIVQEDPEPLTSVRAGLPMELEFIVGKCLSKDPGDRYDGASEIAKDLRTLGDKLKSGRSRVLQTAAPTQVAQPQSVGRKRSPLAAYAAAGVLAVLLAFALGYLVLPCDGGGAAPVYEFDARLPEGENVHSIALSPDGSALVASLGDVGDYSLWIRTMDSREFAEIPGTNGATYPFWSPDSQWIGFFADQQLKKVAPGGAPPQTLCAAPEGRGGTWNRDGVIVFAPEQTGHLHQVTETGGEAKPIDMGEASIVRRFPRFLPDGERLLYLQRAGAEVSVVLASVAGGDPTPVLPDVSIAEYSHSGDEASLVFVRDGKLIAQPIDRDSLELRGAATVLADSVPRTGNQGAFAFTTTPDGAAAYLEDQLRDSIVAWYDRAGRETERLQTATRRIGRVDLSPDEMHAVFSRASTGTIDIWTLDFATGILRRDADFSQASPFVAWSPDSARLVFGAPAEGRSSTGGRVNDIFQKTFGHASAPEVLVDLTAPYEVGSQLMDWSPDGRFLLFWYQGPTSADLAATSADGAGEPFPIATGPGMDIDARFSPDGEWLAFQSDETGRAEVYIQDFPDGARRRQVSTDGGLEPSWRGDGRELYYISPEGALMAIAIDLDDEITAGRPRELFRLDAATTARGIEAAFDVSADGERFLVGYTPGERAQAITVVTDWRARHAE